jgi:chromosome segregation ATPase
MPAGVAPAHIREVAMIKKLILMAVVGGIAVAALRGTRIGSYVRSEIKAVRDTVEEQVPPEREIARLRAEVRNLDQDHVKVVKQLARLQSDQADTRQRVAELEKRKGEVAEVMRARETAVRAAEARAKGGEVNVSVTLGDQSMSLESGRARLKDSVQSYVDLDQNLSRTRAKLASQGRIVEQLERQRAAFGRMKADLDAAIDTLEEEVHALNLQQMESRYQTDGTRAAQIKEALAAAKKRLDVQRRELALLQDADGRPAAAAESVDEIMAPVTKPRPTPAVPAAQAD